MEKVIIKKEKESGGRIFEVTVTIIKCRPPKYRYFYPEIKALGKRMMPGDVKIICEKLGLSPNFVRDILRGTKFRKSVVEMAEQIAEMNDKKRAEVSMLENTIEVQE